MQMSSSFDVMQLAFDESRRAEVMRKISALLKVVDAAEKWRRSRTEYLVSCEIALRAHAPFVHCERFLVEAAVSASANYNLIAALQELEGGMNENSSRMAGARTVFSE